MGIRTEDLSGQPVQNIKHYLKRRKQHQPRLQKTNNLKQKHQTLLNEWKTTLAQRETANAIGNINIKHY